MQGKQLKKLEAELWRAFDHLRVSRLAGLIGEHYKTLMP
jgi:hypothetical protein